MSLRLIIESSPDPQIEMSRSFESGELTLGRGDDMDWQIDDPGMYVSRKHCIISGEPGNYTVTDASRGGLFVDGGEVPLGAGKSIRLEDQMRLRLGDVVLRVEIKVVAPKATPPTEAKTHVGLDSLANATDTTPSPGKFDFSFPKTSTPAPVERRERPASMPKKFGEADDRSSYQPSASRKEAARPLDDHDPFALNLKPRVKEPNRQQATQETQPPAEQRHVAEPPDRTQTATSTPIPDPPSPPQKSKPLDPVGDAQLRAAFYRGLGLDSETHPTENPEAEMEALGERFRELVDGLMQMLRMRAQEKVKVRVASTVIGNADVNPLKFLVTTEEGIQALIKDRGAGYLPPDAAIHGAFHDMIDHQLRTWTAVQSSLRRMVDQFDPETIESEMEDTGLLEALLAGGRSAKLWQLYEERYQKIAAAAEERFLGEVGAEFRDAYEDNKGGRNGR